MYIHTKWLDVLLLHNNDGMQMLEAIPNAARDSLRALLLLALFALTFASGMLATVLRREWSQSHISSLISCVGGGVFLATCLMDLLPDALESYEKIGIESKFPVVEAAVAGGLLLVLAIEQTVLLMQERGWLISDLAHVRIEEERRSPRHSSADMNEISNPMIGVSLLVLALSLHALFEGLSLAVINDASKLLEVFGALVLHKCIIGFSLGVRLVQSGLRTPWVALCSCLFSVQILIGGLGGIEIMFLLSGGDRTTAAIVASILQEISSIGAPKVKRLGTVAPTIALIFTTILASVGSLQYWKKIRVLKYSSPTSD